MALLRRSEMIDRYNRSQSVLLEERKEQGYSERMLKAHAEAFSITKPYDIFLSHSYQDARIVRQLFDELTAKGYEIYVDWIIDKQLDRNRVSAGTASILRCRMNSCTTLIYLTSVSAEKSVWMPWELGYMDAKTSRVAVAPVLDDDEPEFKGREYLGIYPYLDLTNDNFYIHTDTSTWILLERWMRGENPRRAL